MLKKVKFSYWMVSAAAALCLVLPLCAPVMADGAASGTASSANTTKSIKQELSKTGNLVTQYVNQEDQKTKTIIWAKGINPPKMGGPDSDFVREELTTASGTYVTYEAPFQAGQGWYDVNKTGGGDLNLCFAAATSNSLHWWMHRNSDYIDRYLQRNPDDAQVQRLHYLRDSFESQSKSGVFDIFLKQFAYRQDGYWPDILQDQFINGYYLKANMSTHDSPADREKLLTEGPDPHGGFFYKVFGTELLTSRRVYDNGYAAISNDIKDSFMRGDLVLMSFRVNRLQSHVVTLWGAEYDENGKLSAVYFSDSDDREVVGMQRYMVFDVAGKAAVSTRVQGGGNKTNVIECLLILSPGTAQWEKYFANDKKTLDLVWSNTEQTYDGNPHAPTVTVTNLAPGEEVELVVKGQGINAGSYMATAQFKRAEDAQKYNLPEQPTCQFQIKQAAAPLIRYPDASALQYGQILAESTLSGGSVEYGDFVWANRDTVPAVGQQSYPMLFMPSQTTQQNYEPVQNIQAQVTVQVEKAVPTITINTEVKTEQDEIQVDFGAVVHPTGQGEIPSGSISFTIFDENGQLVEAFSEAVLNENGTAAAIWKPAKASSYTIKATYSGNSNYGPADAEMLFDTAQQSQQPIVVQPIGTKTYGDASFEIQVEGGSGQGDFVFSSSAPDVIGVDNSTATIYKAGTAVITVTKVSDGIFASAQVSVPVTVGKKTLTVTAENKLDIMQGEQMPAFTYKVEGLVSGDQFSDPQISVVPLNTNTPGEYEIAITGGQLTNAESYAVTYNNGKLIVLPQEIPSKPSAPSPVPEKTEVPDLSTMPQTHEPSVIWTMPEKATANSDGTMQNRKSEEVLQEKHSSVTDTTTEKEKNALPESNTDSIQEEATVSTTPTQTIRTEGKVIIGIIFVLLLFAVVIILYYKRRTHKQ